jgi:hypothetical protein
MGGCGMLPQVLEWMASSYRFKIVFKIKYIPATKTLMEWKYYKAI